MALYKKAKSRRYPVETTTDAINEDDIALLENVRTQAEFLLHYLGQALASTYMLTKASECVLNENEPSPL